AMGQEAICNVTIDGNTKEAKALLETDELIVRGAVRRRIPLASILETRVEDGRLTLVAGDGDIEFELGPLAEKWAEKIRNPRILMDKLGVKAGLRVRIC